LNFNGSKQGRDFLAQLLARNDVTAFHRHDLVFGDVGRSKQSAAMDFTIAYLRFGRTTGERYHRSIHARIDNLANSCSHVAVRRLIRPAVGRLLQEILILQWKTPKPPVALLS